jgi:hypothetical protein
VKISLRLVSWLDILDIIKLHYSLHSVQTLREKKNEVLSIGQYTSRVTLPSVYSHSFSLSNTKVIYSANIGAIGTFLRNVCIVLFLKCHRKKDIADGLTLSFLGYIQCDLFANKNERVAP